MARSLNKVQLIGHVGQEPEFKTFGSGGARLATFGLATSEGGRNKATGESFERTEWNRVVVFGESLIRVIEQYVRKGSKLYIEGRLRTRTWEDKQGQQRDTTEVVLSSWGSSLILLDASRGDHAEGYVAGRSGSPPSGAEFRPMKPEDVTVESSGSAPSEAAFRPSNEAPRPGGVAGTPRRDSAFPASFGQSAEPDYGEELDDGIPF